MQKMFLVYDFYNILKQNLRICQPFLILEYKSKKFRSYLRANVRENFTKSKIIKIYTNISILVRN